jgi:predicted alpha/beta-hydrolase family hydrolase
MAPYVDGLVGRGVDALALDLPRRRAEEAVSRFVELAPPAPGAVVGGHSYGGRVASLAAAGRPYAGLILLSYPLHRPGAPDLDARTAHWASIDCPVLLLSGESDPFARVDLLREAVARLRTAELVTYPRLGHGLLAVVDDVVDRMARFVGALPGA